MNKSKNKNAAAAVREVLETTPLNTVFSGYELKNKVVSLCPDAESMYVDTLLREMRGSCRLDYVLFDRAKSLYKKITPSRAERWAAELERSKELKQPELF